MKRSVTFLMCLLSSLLVASAAAAECFDFVDAQPRAVGPVELAAPATRVCVLSVSGIGNRHYHSVRFSDALGDLAQLASETEAVGRCPGFCRQYELVSGNSNGQNVDPAGTTVSFQVESEAGSVTVSHPDTGSVTYQVRITGAF
jgi:hypothetical protein